MEGRIHKIQQEFQKDYNEFLQSFKKPLDVIFSTPKKQKVELEKPKEIVKELKEPRKSQRPLMLNKINHHRKQLEKNNLKKEQKVFINHGTLDESFEKTLEEKCIKVV